MKANLKKLLQKRRARISPFITSRCLILPLGSYES